MGIVISWYDEEKHILLWQFVGRWTWHDFEQGRREVRNLIEGVEPPVGMIIDFEHTGLMPSDFVPHLSKLSQQTDVPPVNLINVVVIGDAFLRALVRTLQPFLAAHWRTGIAKNRQEAYDMLQEKFAEQTTPCG